MRYFWKCQCGYKVEVERSMVDRDQPPSELEESDDHFFDCIAPEWERVQSAPNIAVKGFSSKNGYTKKGK